MHLSVEILHHVFSYLVSHRETLIACSKDPALFPIVERHLYHHVIVNLGPIPADREPDYAFEPKRLSELVSKKPYIKHYVRILQIQVNEFEQSDLPREDLLGKAAKHLLMFPALECITLTVSEGVAEVWFFSSAFIAVLKDRLNLPTIKELHLNGSNDFPLSILDSCKNIKYLTLTGEVGGEGQFCDSALPRLKSLALDTHYISSSILAWVKLGIREIHSLKCASLSVKILPELLGVCSETLKRLEIDLRYSPYSRKHLFTTSGECTTPLPTLSHIPQNLQQLTIRAAVRPEPFNANRCVSYLPAAAEAINFFIFSPRLGHLILDIDITFSQFNIVDIAPLAILGPASLSIPRIDLYVHTAENFPSALTRALLFFLMGYEDIVKSIEEGILVIHSEETAPNVWLLHGPI